jgi:phage terminase large subunit GpA-like protein
VNPARSRDAGNSMLSKEFPGGILVLTGANSATGLRSMPARYVFLDEVDAYPASADEEGDPVTLAEARTTTFSHRRKVFMVSTPTIRGLSGSSGSSRHRPAPVLRALPALRAMQWLQFDRLRWARGSRKRRPIIARAAKAHRRAPQDARCWKRANGGRRRFPPIRRPSASTSRRSIRRSAGKAGQQIAREWLAAQGSDEMLRAARNTLLGETWVEAAMRRNGSGWRIGAKGYAPAVPDGRSVPDRRRRCAEGPDRGRCLGLGPGLESWLVDHIVIPGGPDDPACWDKLTALLGRTWPCANGAVMLMASWPSTPAMRPRRFMPGRGRQGFAQVAPDQGPRRLQPRHAGVGPDLCRRHHRRQTSAPRRAALVGGHGDVQGRDLPLPADGTPSDEDRALGVLDAPGTIHLPDWADTEWLKQLVAEQLVTVRNKRGYAHQEWQKMRERNEALDCRVYARAAAWILGADRWDEATWRRLEAQAGWKPDRMPGWPSQRRTTNDPPAQGRNT